MKKTSGGGLVHQCALCHASAVKLQKCGKCLVTYYCSRDHQVTDWPRHKAECKKLQKRGADTLAMSKEDLSGECRKFAEHRKKKIREEPVAVRSIILSAVSDGNTIDVKEFPEGDFEVNNALVIEVALMAPKTDAEITEAVKEMFGRSKELADVLRSELAETDDGQGYDGDFDKDMSCVIELGYLAIPNAFRVSNALQAGRLVTLLGLDSLKPSCEHGGSELDLRLCDPACFMRAQEYACELFEEWQAIKPRWRVHLQVGLGEEEDEDEVEGENEEAIVEGRQEWGEAVHWEAGMSLEDLPSHLTNTCPETTFPPRLRTATLHILRCKAKSPKNHSKEHRTVNVVRKDGRLTVYYGANSESSLGYMVAPGDVILMYPGTYNREILGGLLDIPMEIIGVNGSRDDIIIKHDDSQAFERFMNFAPQAGDRGYAYRLANLTLKGSNFEGIVQVNPGMHKDLASSKDFSASGCVEIYNCHLVCEEAGIQVGAAAKVQIFNTIIEGAASEALGLQARAEVYMFDCSIERNGRGFDGVVYKGERGAVMLKNGASLVAVRCRFKGNFGHAVQLDRNYDDDDPEDARATDLADVVLRQSGTSEDQIAQYRLIRELERTLETVCKLQDCVVETRPGSLCKPDCPSVQGKGPCLWHLPSTPLGLRLRENEAREERERILNYEEIAKQLEQFRFKE